MRYLHERDQKTQKESNIKEGLEGIKNSQIFSCAQSCVRFQQWLLSFRILDGSELVCACPRKKPSKPVISCSPLPKNCLSYGQQWPVSGKPNSGQKKSSVDGDNDLLTLLRHEAVWVT